ncbi:hypothetical protein JCM17960_25430 [Magnetospira thiophila]
MIVDKVPEPVKVGPNVNPISEPQWSDSIVEITTIDPVKIEEEKDLPKPTATSLANNTNPKLGRSFYEHGLKGTSVNGSDERGTHALATGGMDAAKADFDAILREHGIDPATVKPQPEEQGVKYTQEFSDGSVLTVRSFSRPYKNRGSTPTLDVKLNKGGGKNHWAKVRYLK